MRHGHLEPRLTVRDRSSSLASDEGDVVSSRCHNDTGRGQEHSRLPAPISEGTKVVDQGQASILFELPYVLFLSLRR